MDKRLYVGAFFVAGLLLSGAARADYLWFDRQGNTLTVQAGQFDKPLNTIDGFEAVTATGADGKVLALEKKADRMVLSAAAGDVRVTGTQEIDNTTLVYHQARFGRNDTKAANDFELVPTTPNGAIFKLMWKGNVVPATQVNVVTSEGWRRVTTSAPDGTITLATPFAGLYVMEVTARVNNGTVTINGKKYDDVRQTATLSFEVAQ